MHYRENAFGSVEIVTPMGTITLSGQNAYDGALEETEGNLADVLKDLKFERQDKRRILGSIRLNMLHAKNEKAAMAKQHIDRDFYQRLPLLMKELLFAAAFSSWLSWNVCLADLQEICLLQR